MSDIPSTLAAAVVEVQRRLPVLHRDKVATVESQRGKYSYKYVDLASVTEVVMPLLAENRLAFISRTTVVDGHFVLSCALIFAPTGEREEAVMPLPTGTTAQVLGSWLSYGRRYLLACLTGLATSDEDDDGAIAKPATARKTPARRGSSTQDEPRMISDPQSRRLHQLFNQAGITNRDERLAYTAEIVRRDITSSKELTQGEARLVIETLDQAANEPHTEEPA